MNYSIENVKSGHRGRPAKVVKLEGGSEMPLKVWVKTTDEGKAYAKSLRQAKKVVAQSAPAEVPSVPDPTAPETVQG